MKVGKVDCSKRLTSTEVHYKSGKNYITNWGISYFQLGEVLLQIGAASFYYKLGQGCIKNCGSFVLLQIRASVITNWGSLVITKWGSCYYK